MAMIEDQNKRNFSRTLLRLSKQVKTTYALLERDLVGENNRNGGAVGSEGKENQPRG
jgi:hypothetical protein